MNKKRVAVVRYEKPLKSVRKAVELSRGLDQLARFFIGAHVQPTELAAPGTEVTLVWGEDRPSTKVQVEDHVPFPIRATVMPAPLVEKARTSYRSDEGVK